MTHGDAERAIKKLKPQRRNSGDIVFRIECDAGHYIGWTKMSRKRGGVQLSKTLEALMRSQLGVDGTFWNALAGCTKGRPEYLKLHGHNH